VTEKQQHKTVAWFLFGVAVLIILWLLNRGQNIIENTEAAAPGITGAAPVIYNLGDISLPGESVNVGPQTITLGGPPNVGTGLYAYGNCACGCDDQGPSLPFDYSSFNAQIAADNATAQANINNYINSMDYNTGVFLNNGTPVGINLSEAIYATAISFLPHA
jgi:hypothetical protein